MNMSGRAVQYWLQLKKIPLENVLIIVDDLALPFGEIRLRAKGSDAGHNGLKSIDESLGTNQYARLRIGIGSDFSKGKQVNFVLGKWTDAESKALPAISTHSIDLVKSFVFEGVEKAMSLYNKKLNLISRNT